jgi:PhoH-like ATPase
MVRRRSDSGRIAINARQAIPFLERLRLRGNLLDGVPLDNGGTLRIEINCVHEALPDSLPDDQADNRILKVCRHLQQCQPILVTKDLVLRLNGRCWPSMRFSAYRLISSDID